MDNPKLIEFLYNKFDEYHGIWNGVNEEQKDLNILAKDLNNEKYLAPYFTIFEFLEERNKFFELLEIFYWLVENCNDLNKRTENGDTILHLIAKSLKKTNKKIKNDLAKILIDNGCNENLINNQNKTAIQLAKDNYKNFDVKKHWYDLNKIY